MYQALDDTCKRVFADPNVTSVGVGYKIIAGKTTKTLCVSVGVESKIALRQIPKSLRVPKKLVVGKTTVPTDVIPTGQYFTYQRTGRFRPAPGGVSVGHLAVTAGTLGAVLEGPNRNRFILSNNHVLAHTNAANAGDPIIQPGRADGGAMPRDHIATLDRFVPINFGGDNRVDAAIARALRNSNLQMTIRGIGRMAGISGVTLKEKVRKSGRTTELTSGTVTRLSVTARVNMGRAGTARFVDLIETSAMSAPGDSGSLLVNRRNEALGLLFAGSSASTLHCAIANVITDLNLQQFSFGAEVETAAVVYIDDSFGGASTLLNRNVRDARTIGFKDNISSIQMLSGTGLFYEQDGFRGRALYVEGHVADTSAIGFEDNISSIRLFDGPLTGMTVYEHDSYRGKSTFIDSDVRDTRSIDMKDNISSIQIHGGASATVYERDSYRGRSRSISGNIRDTRSIGMKDNISSIRLD